MAITAANYVLEKTSGQYIPAQYPSDQRSEEWILPEDIRSEYSKLNAMIETKYSREYLKICAFYNKLFPALRSSSYITSSYNVPAFTTMDQERTDTGTGLSSNYLKQITDQIVSRIGTVSFEPALIADVPTLEYVIYRDEVERLIRKYVRDNKLNRMVMEVFHDASIIGFSHVFIDPVTHQFVKANDYEIGMFESQFTASDVKQVLYRNYNFPVTSLVPYLADVPNDIRKAIVDDTEGKDHVDFKMYFDCPGKRCVITIGGKTLPDIIYNFDKVQMVTFGWDAGFSRVTATSLFDLLYPTQREMNRVNAKIQQLIRMYKGSVPVFNSDVDLAMKAITNGTGEALYVDSSRSIDTLMTVINPTPIDAQLNATKTELKTEMYELAGIQQVSFDYENIRSAAAVVALDQNRDTVFQAQMQGKADFVADLFKTRVYYNSVTEPENVMWQSVHQLINDSVIDLKPVTVTDPLGNKAASTPEEPDYIQMAIARSVLQILKGELTFNNLSYVVDKASVKSMCAITMVRLEALNISIPDTIEQFMVEAFVDDLKMGVIQL